jgi:hypothetical protein
MQRYKALLRRRKMERIRLENLSLAERLTRRLTGGYSTTQQELEEMREHLRTEQMGAFRALRSSVGKHPQF